MSKSAGPEWSEGAIADAREAHERYRAEEIALAMEFAAELNRCALAVFEYPDRYPEYIEGTRRLLIAEVPVRGGL